jgi:hypothetical protein
MRSMSHGQEPRARAYIQHPLAGPRFKGGEILGALRDYVGGYVESE